MKSSIFSTEYNGGYDTDQVPFETTTTSKSELERMCKRVSPSNNLQEDQMLLDDSIQQFYESGENVSASNNQNILNGNLFLAKGNPQQLQKQTKYEDFALKNEDEAMVNIEKTIRKLKQQAEHFEEKYQSYKSISENQEQLIVKMRKQMKQDKKQYQTYRNFIKGKLESFIQIKELQIARLNQVVKAKQKQIQQIKYQISQKNKSSGMIIEIIDDRVSNYQKKLQKIISQQEAQLEASMKKNERITVQLYNLYAENISLKSQISNIQVLIQSISYERNKFKEQKTAEVKKNKKLNEMLQKAQKDISSIGTYLLRLANNEPDRELQQQVRFILNKDLQI